jgi:hypothetical protein
MYTTRCDCSVIHLSNKAYVRREWLAEDFNRTHLFPKGRPFAAVSPTLDPPFEVHFAAHHRSVRTLPLYVHVTTVIFAVPIPWLILYILLIICTYCVMTLFRLVSGYQRFEGMYRSLILSRRLRQCNFEINLAVK